MKTIYLFATNAFDPVRWGEIFLNLMTLGFRFDEPVLASIRMEANGVVELVVELGTRTAEYANPDFELQNMGGVKEEVVLDPSQQ